MIKRLVCALAIVLIALGYALGSDFSRVEPGAPLTMMDTYPVPYLEREVTGIARYGLSDEKKSIFTLAPRLNYGFWPNWQASLTVPFIADGGETAGSGDVSLDILNNLNTETTYMPAMSLLGGIELPTGHNNNGFDTRLQFIASKMPFRNALVHRVHLNLAWEHNSASKENERNDRFRAVMGFSSRFGDNSLIVTDLVREQERLKKKDANLFETGLRTQLSPLTVLSIGAGAGIGDESPDFRVTIAFQYSF